MESALGIVTQPRRPPDKQIHALHPCNSQCSLCPCHGPHTHPTTTHASSTCQMPARLIGYMASALPRHPCTAPMSWPVLFMSLAQPAHPPNNKKTVHASSTCHMPARSHAYMMHARQLPCHHPPSHPVQQQPPAPACLQSTLLLAYKLL